jgi:acetaldehyde dehydrogenase
MRLAIVGTGNIGTDLLEKLRRSAEFEIAMFAGIDPDSPGLARAAAYGVPTSAHGIDAVLSLDDPVELVFEATSAAVHSANAPRYAEAGLQAIDLTPARIGPPVIPAVNIEAIDNAPNVNLTTCGGQATVPIVAAVSEVTKVEYAEIVSTVASCSAGPGTRQNIDEFTQTTASALETIGRAARGKAIIILNPAEPPILMRNTVFCIVPASAAREAVKEAIDRMVARVQAYVRGYAIVAGPEFDELENGRMKVSVFLQVAGAGDFLPQYAGNLDIMTAAAVAVGEQLAARREVTT